MRAFLNDTKGLGSDHSTITKEYKSLKAMYRFAILPFLRTHGGVCNAEIFYNWDNRYGTPDLTKTFELKANNP